MQYNNNLPVPINSLTSPIDTCLLHAAFSLKKIMLHQVYVPP